MRRSLPILSLFASVARSYTIVNDFSGIGFFNEGNWDFYGNYDNLTLGDVIWLNEADAYTQQLAYVNAAGNVILRVDDFTNVPFNDKRNSVRITTAQTFDMGSLWIIDAVHLPYGCSVWPSIWTMGSQWPQDGINMMLFNQYALHTTEGCIHTTPPDQSGSSSLVDCSGPSGCLVAENKPNSYQSGFAAAGGGVWAAQFDYTGIFIWFWTRDQVPNSIAQSTSTSSMDLSDWGAPSAAYVNTTCSIEQFFGPQKLVIDITLCGEWAGLPSYYNATCANTGPTGICYNDNVVGSGANYDQAYFELQYIRAYTTAAPGATATAETNIGHNKSGASRTRTRAAAPLWLTLLWYDAFPTPTSTPPSISASELADIVLDPTKEIMKDYVVVDVRRADFENYAIPGCLNLPAHSFYQTLPTVLKLLQRVPLVVFHCNRCKEGSRGWRVAGWYADAAKTAGVGYKAVTLEGGIRAWAEAYADNEKLAMKVY
uniref:Rhodanese domain-containing protein n=1 Tax=Mycena chlorophos TaxID=658473 RepID=A0ABQ0M8X3_MYCCL|nr:predicted protein [Mycena chlorophos]GAT59764.1 predicted protein [Mycena chlorophos]